MKIFISLKRLLPKANKWDSTTFLVGACQELQCNNLSNRQLEQIASTQCSTILCSRQCLVIWAETVNHPDRLGILFFWPKFGTFQVTEKYPEIAIATTDTGKQSVCFVRRPSTISCADEHVWNATTAATTATSSCKQSLCIIRCFLASSSSIVDVWWKSLQFIQPWFTKLAILLARILIEYRFEF